MDKKITVELTKQEVEILLDYLPSSYKQETPEVVKALKLKIWDSAYED